jgi:hypothetical protein
LLASPGFEPEPKRNNNGGQTTKAIIVLWKTSRIFTYIISSSSNLFKFKLNFVDSCEIIFEITKLSRNFIISWVGEIFMQTKFFSLGGGGMGKGGSTVDGGRPDLQHRNQWRRSHGETRQRRGGGEFHDAGGMFQNGSWRVLALEDFGAAYCHSRDGYFGRANKVFSACVTIPRLLERVCPSTPKIDGFYHAAAKTRVLKML